MAKLYLRFEETVLKEVPLSEGVTTIGRLPDNDVRIDNLAVSGHHCRIFLEGDQYVVEDGNSLNGTYVNQQRINKCPLNDGDEVLVGKHVLQFREEVEMQASHRGSKPAAEPVTDVVEAQSSRSVHPVLEMPRPTPVTVAAPTRALLGVMTVLDGKDDARYVLTGKLTVIGKSDMASIKLKGWFAPNVAANVMKRDSKYVISAADKDVKISINGTPITGQQELAGNDIVELAGTRFKFTLE